MELSEARAVLELTHDQLLRRWDGESSEWTPSRYRAEAIDTILAALDAATQDAQQQRERAEMAEGERDRLAKAFEDAEAEIVRLQSLLTPEQVDAELSRLKINVTPAWHAIKASIDAVYAAGLPAKGAADAGQS